MRKTSFLLCSVAYVGAFALTALSLSACSSAPQVLSVKSFPAEAEVCVKGHAGAQWFDQKPVCIGQTPFEADHFDYVSTDGKKNRIDFKDLKPTDKIYLVLRKDGYATQSTQIPSWEQFLSLNHEKIEPAKIETPVVAAIPENGALRILSNPPGALVYINGSLQGNTPYVYQYPIVIGQPNTTGGVSVKLEAPGFGPFERMVNLNQVGTQEINFQLDKMNTDSASIRRRAPASMSEETQVEEETEEGTADNS